MYDSACDLWAAEPMALEAFLRASGAIFEARMARRAERVEARPAPEPDGDGTLRIPVRGMMLRGNRDPWLDLFGFDHAPQNEIRAALDRAASDPAVRRVVLDVDSPGGHARGMGSLVAAARRVRESGKPFTALVSGQACSAAYMLAAQAQSVVAEPDAAVGSIGAYCVVADASDMLAKEGITVHVIASGKHKGVGVFGAPVTQDQLARIRADIDDIADDFVGAVANGRGMGRDSVKNLATGETWIARKAVALKLVDRVEGRMDDVLNEQAEDASEGMAAVAVSINEIATQLSRANADRDEALRLAEAAEARATKAEAALAAARKEVAGAYILRLKTESAAKSRPIPVDALAKVEAMFTAGRDAEAREIGEMFLSLAKSEPSFDGMARQKPVVQSAADDASARAKEAQAEILRAARIK